MLFESYPEALSFLLWSVFLIAVVMGAVVNKTNFCTMGAVSDWVNMGHTGRFRSWVLAMTVALIGALILEGTGMLNLDGAFPAYRASNLMWVQNIVGGVLFGIGMTLGSGCANKNLVRFGGGNLKALLVIAVMGVFAYFMIFPFPGSDKTLMSELFLPWTGPLTVDLGRSQDLGSLVAPESALTARLWIGGIAAVALLALVFRNAEFRRSFDNILGGLVIGGGVIAGWYISSSIMVQGVFDTVPLAGYVADWSMMDTPEGAVRPITSDFVGSQSFTFVNPTAQAAGYVGYGFGKEFLTFGLMAFAGVIVGSLLWSLIARNFRLEWFHSWRDFFNHFIGAALMGVGGVLALGCTIGQGVTGISTMALGSILTFGSIVLGSALTMKVSFYRMVYEDEASFGKAFITALVDLKLLPAGMRKLESV